MVGDETFSFLGGGRGSRWLGYNQKNILHNKSREKIHAQQGKGKLKLENLELSSSEKLA